MAIQIEDYGPYQKEPLKFKQTNENGELVPVEKYTDTRRLIRTYSDADLQIRRVGTDEVYESGEVIEVDGHVHKYEELPLRAVRGPQEVIT